MRWAPAVALVFSDKNFLTIPAIKMDHRLFNNGQLKDAGSVPYSLSHIYDEFYLIDPDMLAHIRFVYLLL